MIIDKLLSDRFQDYTTKVILEKDVGKFVNFV